MPRGVPNKPKDPLAVSHDELVAMTKDLPAPSSTIGKEAPGVVPTIEHAVDPAIIKQITALEDEAFLGGNVPREPRRAKLANGRRVLILQDMPGGALIATDNDTTTVVEYAKSGYFTEII